MNIIGPDELVFGVEDFETAARYLSDYGLTPVDGGSRFEALDGTGVQLKSASDKSLPPATSAMSKLRETIYGVADDASLEVIAAEMRKDREVVRAADDSISCFD